MRSLRGVLPVSLQTFSLAPFLISATVRAPKGAKALKKTSVARLGATLSCSSVLKALTHSTETVIEKMLPIDYYLCWVP